MPELKKPIKVTEENFETMVVNNKQVIVVDFWAIWCIPCLIMGRTLTKVALRLSNDNLSFGKVNVDLNRNLSAQFGIRAIPCLIVFKNGREAGRIMGAMGQDALIEQLKPYLA